MPSAYSCQSLRHSPTLTAGVVTGSQDTPQTHQCVRLIEIVPFVVMMQRMCRGRAVFMVIRCLKHCGQQIFAGRGHLGRLRDLGTLPSAISSNSPPHREIMWKMISGAQDPGLVRIKCSHFGVMSPALSMHTKPGQKCNPLLPTPQKSLWGWISGSAHSLPPYPHTGPC